MVGHGYFLFFIINSKNYSLLKNCEMVATTKQYTFILYFNYNFKDRDSGVNRERAWAEGKREGALAYLKRLFENKAQFSCIAKDENRTAS